MLVPATDPLSQATGSNGAPPLPPEFGDVDEMMVEDEFDQGDAYDNASSADPSLSMGALQNAPQPSTDDLPQFAISRLLPIPLYRMHGNNSYGGGPIEI